MEIQYPKNWKRVRCAKCPGIGHVDMWNYPAFDTRWGKIISKSSTNYMALIPIPYAIKYDESANSIDYFVKNSDILAKTKVKHS